MTTVIEPIHDGPFTQEAFAVRRNRQGIFGEQRGDRAVPGLGKDFDGLARGGHEDFFVADDGHAIAAPADHLVHVGRSDGDGLFHPDVQPGIESRAGERRVVRRASAEEDRVEVFTVVHLGRRGIGRDAPILLRRLLRQRKIRVADGAQSDREIVQRGENVPVRMEADADNSDLEPPFEIALVGHFRKPPGSDGA